MMIGEEVKMTEVDLGGPGLRPPAGVVRNSSLLDRFVAVSLKWIHLRSAVISHKFMGVLDPYIPHSLFIRRKGLILTLSIFPCSQERIF